MGHRLHDSFLTLIRFTDSELMHKTLLLFIIIMGALVAFFGYCALLIDWLQDYSSGVYSSNLLEAGLESGGLLLYTFFGIKFFNRHVGSLR